MAGGQGRSRYVTLRDIVGQRMRKLEPSPAASSCREIMKSKNFGHSRM